MTWLKYLKQEQAEKIERVNVLSSGKVQMHMTSNGVRRDISADRMKAVLLAAGGNLDEL